jgi:hypothetical protein
MAETIEITAFMDGSVADWWWQQALIGVIAASGLLGTISLLWWLYKLIRRAVQVR